MKVGKEEIDAVAEVMRTQMLSSLRGGETRQFEFEFADYIGCNYAIAVNSGTAALHTALLALGIGEGDEVIVPAYTFGSTAAAVKMCGADVVFADIEKDYYTLDPNDVESKITDKTKAVIVVHLAGIPARLGLFKRLVDHHGLYLIEDACQALGASYMGIKIGHWGSVACFSFYPSKIITTGEGGMITTSNWEIAAKCREIRNHGRGGDNYFTYRRLGFNYRMTEIQAAIGRVQLRKIEKQKERYNSVALNIIEMLRNNKKYIAPNIPDSAAPAFTYLILKNPNETNFDRKFYTPLYKTKFFKQDIELPNTEEAYKHCFTMQLT